MDVSKDKNGANFQELGEAAQNLIRLDKNPRNLGIITKSSLKSSLVKKLVKLLSK